MSEEYRYRYSSIDRFLRSLVSISPRFDASTIRSLFSNFTLCLCRSFLCYSFYRIILSVHICSHLSFSLFSSAQLLPTLALTL